MRPVQYTALYLQTILAGFPGFRISWIFNVRSAKATKKTRFGT